MFYIKDPNATPTYPKKDPVTTNGFAPKSTDPLTAATFNIDFLNTLIRELENVVNAYVGPFDDTNDHQLLDALQAALAGVTANTLDLYVRRAGDQMSGSLSIQNAAGASLITLSYAQIGKGIVITPSGATTGQTGTLDFSGAPYASQIVNGTTYPGGTSAGIRQDSYYTPGVGQLYRVYSLGYQAGQPIYNYNINTGLISAADLQLGNNSNLLVSKVLQAIGNGGDLHVRGLAANGNRNILFMNGDPSTTDGGVTGVISQLQNVGTSGNNILISANYDGSFGVQVTELGSLSVPQNIISARGYVTPGFINQFSDVESFTGNTWTVPSNVFQLRITTTGGGGGGASCYNTGNGTFISGAGGGAGGFSRVVVGVNPGQVLYYSVGGGGAGGQVDGNGNITTAGNGGTTTVYNITYATGGYGGAWNTGYNAAGGGGGAGYTGLTISGGVGSDGMSGTFIFAGNGGSSFWGGGGRAGAFGGIPATAWGSGGGGAYVVNPVGVGAGSAGASGMVLIEW